MKELQAKAKVTQTMTRDGLVVENQADGTVENVSSREAEQDYSTDAEGKAEKILERAEDIKDGHKNKKKAKKAVVCLLSVIRVLPYGIAFAAVLVCVLFADPHTLRAVDYSLLLTFVAFFIFIGNLGRIPAFSGWLQEFLTGREVLVAVLASQVTSNVPAALLLSGFTAETQALIIGTNLGGLGTLIASMASLISYRQIARELPQGKKQYFGLFTLSNLIFLAILLGVWFLLR